MGKFVLALLACGLVGLGLVACNNETSTPGTTKVALLMPGSALDGGWNQGAKTALDKVAKELGIQATYLEKVNRDKAGDEMRDFSARGYSLIIGHGYEYVTPASTIAAEHPKTKFAVSGADVNDPNVVTLNYDLAQACYQLGIIAAKTTRSNRLAFIGGQEIPSLIACRKGYEAGAKSVNPAITVLSAYTSWDRPELSKSQTETFLQQGADVVLQNVDAASRGVLEAIAEHNARNPQQPAYVFGTNSNINDHPLTGAYTLASGIIRLDESFLRLVKSLQNGTLKGGVIQENLANEICVTIINPKLVKSGLISAETVKLVAAAGESIKQGVIVIR